MTLCATAIFCLFGVFLLFESGAGCARFDSCGVSVRTPESSDVGARSASADGSPSLSTIRELLTDRNTNTHPLVRLRAEIVRRQSDGSLVLTDGICAMVVFPENPSPLPAETRVEVIGRASQLTHSVALQHATIRRLDESESLRQWSRAGAELPTITTVGEIRRLSPSQAGQAYPIRIRGVVTYYSPFYHYFFVQDSTAGIFVDAQAQLEPLKVGQIVSVQALTGPGFFAPIIRHPLVRVLGSGALPKPYRVTPEAAASGAEDSQWVEVEGIMHPMTATASGISFALYTPMGLIHVSMPASLDTSRLRALTDALVQLRGPFGTVFNQRRQIVGYQMFLPGVEYLRVVKPASNQVERLNAIPISNLLHFSQAASDLQHRVKIRGVVVMSRRPKDFIYVQDDTSGVEVQVHDQSARVGDVVEAVGYPAAGEYSPVLRDAILRNLGRGAAVEPKLVSLDLALQGSLDSQLIEIRARLLSIVRSSTGTTLVLKDGTQIFNAQIDDPPSVPRLRTLKEDSVLKVRGVCSVQTDPRNLDPVYGQQPVSFELLLRTVDDIEIEQRAPWWTVQKALLLLALLSVSTCLVLFWIYLLRCKVRTQTAELWKSKNAAEDAAHALQDAYERIRADATHDALTGLLNRPAVLSRLGEELERSQREQTNLSVLLIDVDHFKHVNDRYGHLYGDAVLRQVAYRMECCLRQYDHIGRYGGEEFLVVLPGASLDYARNVGERLRLGVSQSEIGHERTVVPITISIGAASAPELVEFDETRMLAAADRALYKAKEEGRNRVVVALQRNAEVTTTRAQTHRGTE